MNKLVQDQVLDYKLMTGATDTDVSLPEDERHADYYYQVPSPSQHTRHTHTHATFSPRVSAAVHAQGRGEVPAAALEMKGGEAL